MTNKVALEIDGKGIIKIELNETAAPITVENFKQLVADGFYDGLIFHRVISGFMIQGGDPTGTGCGGSQNNIKGEFRMNGVNNPISHLRGVISMARSGHPDSASSQFFICHEDAKFLDGQYAAFGKVFEGMDVVDRIANTATNSNDRPLTNQVIKRAYFID
ncbi:MAG: peptidylprolyl isomerase [Firmicutes bacterium]|nr:peptidylprolyl isomerase [Bacillota bacterium]MDY4559045.1 peptidylprolyl isomerase [Eubacteriales bacterium]